MKLIIKFYKTSDMVLTNFSEPSVKNEQKNGRTDGLTIIIEYFLSLDIGQVYSFLNKVFINFCDPVFSILEILFYNTYVKSND